MDTVLVISAVALLAYAGYSDIRSRSVSNVVWLVMGGAGFILAVYRTVSAGPAFLAPVLLSLVFTGLLAYVFYRLGFLGAADAKALICLALLLPTQPAFSVYAHAFPLFAPPAALPFPPALLTLFNGLVLALAVPFGLFLYNLHGFGIRGMAGNGALSFVAYRADIDRLGGQRFIRLAHAYEENGGRLSRRFAPGGLSLTGETLLALQTYRRQGIISGGVWVTPQLPFMLFLALGFIACCLLGV